MMGDAFATTSSEQKKEKNHATCDPCSETVNYPKEITKCMAATEKGLQKSSGVTATTVS